MMSVAADCIEDARDVGCLHPTCPETPQFAPLCR
jgi:hypothetical protein